VIIGARKPLQLEDNLASYDLSLSAEQVDRLDQASRIELGFRYDFYAKDLARGLIYGGMRDQILP
jgi:diketogulonate reductase-like aldo/keto reductase